MAGKKKGKGGSRPGHTKVQKVTIGEKVQLWNMGGAPMYCAATNRELPQKGMVVRLNDRYYYNFEAARLHA
jgi:hypothetical protein